MYIYTYTVEYGDKKAHAVTAAFSFLSVSIPAPRSYACVAVLQTWAVHVYSVLHTAISDSELVGVGFPNTDVLAYLLNDLEFIPDLPDLLDTDHFVCFGTSLTGA